MFTLSDFLKKILRLNEDEIPESVVYCLKTDASFMEIANPAYGTYACFIFNLVLKGECVVDCQGKEYVLGPNDFFVYLPGIPVKVKKLSKDYSALCLLAEEQAVLNSSMAGVLLQNLCFPISQFNSKLHLTPELTVRISSLLEDCVRYLKSDHILKKDSVYLTVSLIFADILDHAVKHYGSSIQSSSNVDTVIKFLRLLIQNFRQHHDIGFYADAMNITKTHLSRVIKSTTGDTVIDHINRMLMMDASWMLKSTNQNIAEISERLNFADQASFCKFFKRHKGLSPLQYRNSKVQ